MAQSTKLLPLGPRRNGVSPMTNAVLLRSLFRATMLIISSGYCGQAIKLNCCCSSRSVSCVSTADFNAATMIARCALRPMYGLPSLLLPLTVVQALVSSNAQKLLLVGKLPVLLAVHT